MSQGNIKNGGRDLLIHFFAEESIGFFDMILDRIDRDFQLAGNFLVGFGFQDTHF